MYIYDTMNLYNNKYIFNLRTLSLCLETHATFLFCFGIEMYIFQLRQNPTQSKIEDSVAESVGLYQFYTSIAPFLPIFIVTHSSDWMSGLYLSLCFSSDTVQCIVMI